MLKMNVATMCMDRFRQEWNEYRHEDVVAMDETSVYLGHKQALTTLTHKGESKVVIPVSGYDSVRYTFSAFN
jgi:hypothetical protein